MTSVMFRFAALALLACNAQAAVVTGTPVDRVISLLGKLQAQVEREGKKEAAEYDKYACYCKDQADKTLYAIETSEEKISVLKADIEKLDSEIKELDEDIKDLTQTIADKKEAIEKAVAKRKKENDSYKKEAEEIADAIQAITDAIKELKGSKEGMKKAKLNLLQDQLLEVLSLSSVAPSAAHLAAVQSLAQTPADPAKKHAYVYASNDIIATLETLNDQFKDKKNEVNVAEKEKLFAFEEKKQSLENERDFADKDKTEKEGIREDKKSERADKKKDKEAEEKALKADEGFMKELTADGEAQAAQWDQRSKTRADELQAMGDAMTSLKAGGDKYGANALSFMQIRRGGNSAATVIATVSAMVSGEAKRLRSASLTGLALKLSMGGHFDKVVKLIEGLIKKLEDEAKNAADAKSNCDKDMAKAVNKRDKNKLEMEDQEATIAMKRAEKNKLGGEISKLDGEIAELQKAVLEATELRSEEKANNEVTVDDAKAGKKSIDDAIEVLKDFYSSAAFLQGPAKDRNGQSLDDAPKMSYDGDYKGKQGASKGIIGILEVIASDFERTISNTESEEKSSQGDFETFEGDAKQDITDKGKLKGEKEDAVKAATDAITAAKDSMMDAEKLMETALEELEKVTAMCMTGEGTFAERKKQREEEIVALKGAQKILDNWKA